MSKNKDYPEVTKLLDEAINIIDKISSFISRIEPNKKVERGILFQLYQNTVLLREKIVEARMKSLSMNAKE
ncbi:MAG: hypothetical protein J7J82_04210 [Staphylothermus sp.]|nr:hypothetical protein [Staphylothermus sp.]